MDDTNNISLIEKLLDALNMTGEVKATASVIIAIGVILICGFMMTRLTKLLKLPNVTAYIITGIIIGPSVINLIPKEFISSTSFLGDIALAFIAFSVGDFFKIKELKKVGTKVIFITLMEAMMAFVLTFVVCFFLCQLEFSFALVLATLASATSPTSTIMTIKQTESKGKFVNTLLEVIALNNVISLLLYSVAISVCVALSSGGQVGTMEILWPIINNVICVVIGIIFGFILEFLIPAKRTTDNRLIIVVAIILLFCGICALFGQSPLLGCMAIGIVYTNKAKEEEKKLFAQVNYFIPPIMLLFFVRSGMSFSFGALTTPGNLVVPLIVVVIAYFFTRLIGKYSGAYLGSTIVRAPRPTRLYLGLGLIPQASVAIALATTGARTLTSINMEETATAMITIVLTAAIIFELIGPGFSKLALYLSHSYGKNIDEIVPKEEVKKEVVVEKGSSKEVDTLVAQIQRLSKEVGHINDEEIQEEAFTEAAEEYQTETSARNFRHFINRK